MSPNVYSIAIALLAASTQTSVAATLPCEARLAEAAVPADAYFLPESEARNLQQALNEHRVVRLKANGNYVGRFPIRLSSNQELYGLASTRVPDILISAGAENVIVSDIHNRKIFFPPSQQITKSNCFSRIRTSVTVRNAKLQNNVFMDIQGGIVDIKTSQSGFMRNNRFIKTMTHTAWPALTLLGNEQTPSYGNHFVWTNILGPLGDSVVVDKQRDIAFTGIDVESWSWGDLVQQQVPIHYPAAINVSNTDYLSIFMSHGGNHRIKDAQYFNLDAKTIFLQGSLVETQTKPGLLLGDNVEQLLAVNTRTIGHQASNETTQVIEIFKDNKVEVAENWRPIPGYRLSANTRPTINDILNREKNIYQSWDKPTYEAISTPTILNLSKTLTALQDHTAFIQEQINRNGFAQLDAGIYYISKPIALKNDQGIVGAGADKTIIIAKNNNISMIVGANHIDDERKSNRFFLADLTLQGGKHGILHAPSGSGKGAQYNRSVLSHVTFRNMSDACISISSIYGWDNNFLDNINFIDCGTAIKQRPDPLYQGGDAFGITYMDKNVCYRCRFINNDTALDMPGKRGNGLNAFISSEFMQNGQILKAIHPLSNFFFNCQFTDNRGDPAIETNRTLGFVHSDFTTHAAGSLFQRQVLCNDCKFQLLHPRSQLMATNNPYKAEAAMFINSNIETIQSDTIYSGLVLDHTRTAGAIAGELISNHKTFPLY